MGDFNLRGQGCGLSKHHGYKAWAGGAEVNIQLLNISNYERKGTVCHRYTASRCQPHTNIKHEGFLKFLSESVLKFIKILIGNGSHSMGVAWL
jgi:hypothetical protein